MEAEARPTCISPNRDHSQEASVRLWRALLTLTIITAALGAIGPHAASAAPGRAAASDCFLVTVGGEETCKPYDSIKDSEEWYIVLENPARGWPDFDGYKQ